MAVAAGTSRKAGRIEFRPNQAFLFGATCLMIAALVNLLPLLFALRGTPAGQARNLVDRKQEAIDKLDRKMEDLREGRTLLRGKPQEDSNLRKGYQWHKVEGEELEKRLQELEKRRAELGKVLDSEGFRWEQEQVRNEVAGRYEVLRGIHAPAIYLLRLAGRPVDFTDRQFLDNPGRRAMACLLLFVFWMPLAFVVGGILAILGWPRGALSDMKLCRREGRQIMLPFLLADGLWFFAFLAVSAVENLLGLEEPSPVMGYVFASLWVFKSFQLYLVLRGCLVLGVRPWRTLLMGSLAGMVLIYWVALLMLYEEFSHALGLMAARQRTTMEAKEREAMKEAAQDQRRKEESGPG